MSVHVLAGLAVPAVIEAIKTGLEKIDHPAASGAASALDSLGTAISAGAISADQVAQIAAHTEKMAQIGVSERNTAMSEINQSLRAEVSSGDIYVRRMRPTFGYMMAGTWGAQMMAVAYLIVADPARAADVLRAMESLGTIWMVALSVMGIYVYQRSNEKMADTARQVSAIGSLFVKGTAETKTPRYND